MKCRACFLKNSYVITLILLCICFCGCKRSFAEKVQSTITEGRYQGVYLYGDGALNITEKDFNVYRGLDIKPIKYNNISLEDLAESIEIVGNAAATTEECYITIDPYKLWKSCGEDYDRFDALANRLLTTIISQAASNTTIFEFMFPARSIDYWIAMGGDAVEDAYMSYRKITEMLVGHENVFLYGYGLEEWLYMNLLNFNGGRNESLVDSVNLKMFMSTLCDRLYAYESVNDLDKAFDILRDNISDVNENGFPKVNTNGATIIALGDSIFGNYTDSTSIAAIIENFSDATVFNCGIGGINASDDPQDYDLNDLTEIVLGNMSYEPEDGRDDFKNAAKKLKAFSTGSRNATDNNLVFIVEFGLNDYFNRCTTDDYKDALERGITKLLNSFPGAKIVIVAPGYVGAFDSGNEPHNELGEVLDDFRKACTDVANSFNCSVVNLIDARQITADNIWKYTEDGTHYNIPGRFYVGVKVLEALK